MLLTPLNKLVVVEAAVVEAAVVCLTTPSEIVALVDVCALGRCSGVRAWACGFATLPSVLVVPVAPASNAIPSAGRTGCRASGR